MVVLCTVIVWVHGVQFSGLLSPPILTQALAAFSCRAAASNLWLWHAWLIPSMGCGCNRALGRDWSFSSVYRLLYSPPTFVSYE